jgi:hypothetical protein
MTITPWHLRNNLRCCRAWDGTFKLEDVDAELRVGEGFD